MATDLFIDLDANRLVKGLKSTVPVSPSSFFRNDVRDLNLYFLRQTGIAGSPYVSADKSAAAVKLAVGDKLGVPTSGTWTLDGVSCAFDVSAATLQASLRTSQSDASLTVTGSMALGFTVTWSTVGAESALIGDVSGLLPECDLTIGERRAGSGSAKEQQYIRVRLAAAAFQDTFTDIATTVSATISTLTAGTSSVSETQKIALSRIPVAGGWTITAPADTRSITAAVSSGVFTTTENHGFVIGQPVIFSSFTGESNFTEGVTYWVANVSSPKVFTISTTQGGGSTSLPSSSAGSGVVTTVPEITAQLGPIATLAEVQSALEALDCIGAGNVAVTGIPGEYYQIAFQATKALSAFVEFTADVSSLSGAFGKNGELNLATYQMADLLGSESSRELSLEIQLIEGGITETVISQPVVVTSDLIDGATLSPVALPVNLFSLKTSDQSVTSSTDLVDCDELSLSLAANATYIITGGVTAGCAAAVYMKGVFTVPSGASMPSRWISGTAHTTSGPVFQQLSAWDTTILINGMITVGATSGNITFQFAQNASSASPITVKSGSFIKAERVA